MLSRLAVSTLCRGGRSLMARPQPVRLFNQKATRLERIIEKRRTMKETFAQPAGETAFQVGKGFVAGASVLGLGALCYYGLGLSSEAGTLERSVAWPEYVRERVRSTYAYFGGSVILTAASALSIVRSPAAMNLIMRNTWPAMLGSIALIIGSGMVVRSMPYQPGFNGKQFAWAAHSALMGAMIAPVCLLGGPLLVRAACYTAGIIGGLSTVAVCAPSDKFLYMAGPLSIGLGVVFASSLGSMFLPPTTLLGAGLYSMSLYGGLVLFSGFLLYDTQRIMHKAESHPQYALVPYDPINCSLSIYMDTINIFIRIATILAGGGGRKR